MFWLRRAACQAAALTRHLCGERGCAPTRPDRAGAAVPAGRAGEADPPARVAQAGAVAAVAGSIALLQRGTGVERIAYALLPGPIPGGVIGRGAVLYLAVLAPVAATYLAGLARRSVLRAQQAAVRESVAAADSERAA